jgi:hypothetical protein
VAVENSTVAGRYSSARAGKFVTFAVCQDRACALLSQGIVQQERIQRRIVSSWYALFAPSRTPPEIIRKMHEDTVAALSDPTTKERLEQLGVVVVGSTPEELAAFLKAEMDKWAPVIKEAGITIRE